MIDKNDIVLGILAFNSITLYFLDLVWYADIVSLVGLVYFYMQLKDPQEIAVDRLNQMERTKTIKQQQNIPTYNTESSKLIDLNSLTIEQINNLKDQIKQNLENTIKLKQESQSTESIPLLEKFQEMNNKYLDNNSLREHLSKINEVPKFKTTDEVKQKIESEIESELKPKIPSSKFIQTTLKKGKPIIKRVKKKLQLESEPIESKSLESESIESKSEKSETNVEDDYDVVEVVKPIEKGI